MTSRQEAAARRTALVVDLVADISRGRLALGTAVPSVSCLAKRYGIGAPTVVQALRPLVDDGTLSVRPGVGYFVAGPARPNCHYVVLVGSRQRAESWPVTRQLLRTFETQIAAMGGQADIREVDEFLAEHSPTDPAPFGLFHFTGGRLDEVVARVGPATPLVRYLGGGSAPPPSSGGMINIDLDNVEGGRIATRQLLCAGHSAVAFIGIHTATGRRFPWSRQRAQGWLETMHRHQPRAPLLQVLPRQSAGPEVSDRAAAIDARHQVAREAVHRLAEFSACVASEDLVLEALARELRAQRVPESRWPAMVGFERLVRLPSLVASVEPDWAGLGGRAAELLLGAARKRRPSPGVATVAMSVSPLAAAA